MHKYGSFSPEGISVDSDGDPEPIRRTASRPLTEEDVAVIETEDGPAVQEPGE